MSLFYKKDIDIDTKPLEWLYDFNFNDKAERILSRTNINIAAYIAQKKFDIYINKNNSFADIVEMLWKDMILEIIPDTILYFEDGSLWNEVWDDYFSLTSNPADLLLIVINFIRYYYNESIVITDSDVRELNYQLRNLN